MIKILNNLEKTLEVFNTHIKDNGFFSLNILKKLFLNRSTFSTSFLIFLLNETLVDLYYHQ